MPRCDVCKLKRLKLLTEKPSAIEIVTELLYPQFSCKVCLQSIAVCRLCESAEWKNDLVHQWGADKGFTQYYLITIRDFLYHLFSMHHDSRYISFTCGRVYLVGYNEPPNKFGCTESDAFVWDNPHVLFMNTFGPDYVHGGLNHVRDSFDHNYAEGRIIASIYGDDTPFAFIIRQITQGSNSCTVCGEDYDAFPTLKIFISHIKSCVRDAESIVEEKWHGKIKWEKDEHRCIIE